jgi:serine/threonine protein kinase
MECLLRMHGYKLDVEKVEVEEGDEDDSLSQSCDIYKIDKQDFNVGVGEIDMSYSKKLLIARNKYLMEQRQKMSLLRIGLDEHGKYKYRFSVLLEYIPDGDLESKIREHGRMDAQVSFYLLFQVVKALYSLRGVDIVWKDLRTRNIMIYYNKGSIAVKIGDFGYNKFVGITCCILIIPIGWTEAKKRRV